MTRQANEASNRFFVPQPMRWVCSAMLQSLRQGLVMALFLSLTGTILFQANFAHCMVDCGIGFTLVLFALSAGEILTSDVTPSLRQQTEALSARLRRNRSAAPIAVQPTVAVQLTACTNQPTVRPLRRAAPSDTPPRQSLSEFLAARTANPEFDAIELQLSS
jgi:hypothetical protein